MTSEFPSSIQAITIDETGGVDVLKKTAVPFPKVKPEHIVVKVQYLGINFIDIYYRQGLYPVDSLPTILGTEAAGTIIKLPTDPTVLNDEDYKKRGYQVGGTVAVFLFGSHAEYISLPWKRGYPAPASISSLTAAASLIQGLTAVSFMTEAYNVQRGDFILIHTVAGGLGLIFAQLAKHRGATVIGTTSTKEKAALAKANGADHVILYPVEDTVQRVLEITNGEGVHGVFDGVGKDTFENNLKLIRRKGTLVSVGNASGAVPPISPLKLVAKNVKLVRPAMGNYCFTAEESRSYGAELYDLISKGVINIHIHKEYPFTAEGVQQAHGDLTGGKTIGKLVVKVAD
jgi:NADPH2:quinone reductase